MFNDPMRRQARSPQEQEWLQFAGEYRMMREEVAWAERHDFVMSCLYQLDRMGGLTEKQWAAAVNDYRLPGWRRYRAELERRAQDAARKAASEVQARYREHVRRGYRPSRSRDAGYTPPGYESYDSCMGAGQPEPAEEPWLTFGAEDFNFPGPG